MSVYEVRIGDTFVNVDGPIVTLSGSLRFNVSEGDGEFLEGLRDALDGAHSNALTVGGGS